MTRSRAFGVTVPSPSLIDVSFALFDAAPLPATQIDDAEERLWEVTAVAELMTTALGIAAGTLLAGHLHLSSDLEVILELLVDSSNQLVDWIYYAAFEGARQVLAGIQAHHPNTNLWSIVRPPTRSPNP
jgi:hypothetical protein